MQIREETGSNVGFRIAKVGTRCPLSNEKSETVGGRAGGWWGPFLCRDSCAKVKHWDYPPVPHLLRQPYCFVDHEHPEGLSDSHCALCVY